MKMFFLALSLWASVCGAYAATDLKTGDILFLSESGNFAKAIQLATHSPYNHVGMVFIKNGVPYVFEAVGPVKFTPLEEFAAHGIDGSYVAKRLKNAGKVLTPKVLKKMDVLAEKFKGRAYSSAFDWSDSKMYCSELVWKMYQRAAGVKIGKFQKLSEFDLSHPVVKKELEKRFGGFLPLGLQIISPGAMFESDLLEKVNPDKSN